MPDAQHASDEPAIIVAPNARGWTWELIDSDGCSIAAGVADNQEAAMQRAWEAARASPAATPKPFPDIVLQFGASSSSSATPAARRRRRRGQSPAST
jgi:hypothetical protein